MKVKELEEHLRQAALAGYGDSEVFLYLEYEGVHYDFPVTDIAISKPSDRFIVISEEEIDGRGKKA